MSSSSVDLSVMVASYNTCELLRDCLQSVYDSTHDITFEVIVTDDCSSDDSVQMVRECFPKVILVQNPANMRYAKSNNKALKITQGRYGLLLDSDTVVQTGAFATLVRFMDEHPDVAAAGPKLINPDGSIQHCIRSFTGMWPMVFQSLLLHKLFPGNRLTDQYYNTRFDYSREQPVDSIGTTAFIIRRSAWEAYGMLDERFTIAFVDLAYCLMLKLNKQRVYYVPDAVVIHFGNRTINANGFKEIRLMHQSLRVFYDSYYAPRHNFIVRALVHLGIPLREQLKLLEFRLSKNKQVFGGIAISSRNRD